MLLLLRHRGEIRWRNTIRYSLAIFDLDGTLLDTLPDIATAANEVLDNMGLPTHPPEDYSGFIGSGVVVLFERALPEIQRSPQTIRECAARFVDSYKRHWNQRTKPYDQIPELLDALLAAGYKLAILSNKPDPFTKMCVAEYFSAIPFSPVFGQREGIGRKPDPQAVYEINKLSGVPAAQLIFVGHTTVDVKTAKNAGICAAGATWGYWPREELVLSGADFLVDHPLELLSLLTVV